MSSFEEGRRGQPSARASASKSSFEDVLLKALEAAQIVHPAEAGQAWLQAQEEGLPVTRVLLAKDMVSEPDLGRVLSRLDVGMYFDVGRLKCLPYSLVPASLAERICAIPIDLVAGRIILAMADPQERASKQAIELMTGRSLLPVCEDREAILRTLCDLYPPDVYAKDWLVQLATYISPDGSSENDPVSGEPAGTKLVHTVLSWAILRETPEVYFEPGPDAMMVRLTRGGALQDEVRLPRHVHVAIARRVRAMAGLDILARGLKRKSGTLRITHDDIPYTIAVSINSSAVGEKVALRIRPETSARD